MPRNSQPSTHNPQLLLRARLVLPISRPAIPNGAVLIRGNRIAAVGPWRELASAGRHRVMDLGETVLLPGLVNAHCHLDYTHMAGQFPPPKLFTDWLKLIVSTKAGWSLSDYAASWQCGAEMLLRTGTTTVADIEAVPQLLPRVWERTPLRVLSFLEMIGLTGRRPPQTVLQEALDKMDSLAGPLTRLGLSPHAPYSTVPELLRLTAAAARKRHLPVTVHLAESAAEFEMFTHAHGDMFTWLQRSGRDMSDCGSVSPVQHLHRCGVLGRRLLAVHVNYLAQGDAKLLSQSQTSVVHCPRSHHYFRHEPFPLRRLARAGVNICLGTDSLATVYQKRHHPVELNMFDEMRALAHTLPSLSPRTLLKMATINGARALGRPGRLGELSPNALADLITVPYAGPGADVYEAVLHHPGDIAACMLNGQWTGVEVPRQMNSIEEELNGRLAAIREQGLYRELRRIDSPQNPQLQLDGKALLSFASNDYLGLANEPSVKEAAIKAVERYGAGAGASRLICGSLTPHRELDETLAVFKGTEAALSFSTGYAAAQGAICALLGKDDIIILDKLVHACIVDAARLSGAKLRVFAHNDLNDLERILQWAAKRPRSTLHAPGSTPPLIVTESIFSMDGDHAPLREIADLKDQYGAWLMVDEAHATGLYGPHRRGLAEQLNVSERIEIQMGTLGKALGASGGYIAGSRALIDYLINSARSFIFSTAPVPAAAAAATAAVRFVQSSLGEQRRQLLWQRVSELHSTLNPQRSTAHSAIIPLLIGDETAAVQTAAALRNQGIFIPAIRYPTVARGQARLRLTLTAAHTAAHVAKLNTALSTLGSPFRPSDFGLRISP